MHRKHSNTTPAKGTPVGNVLGLAVRTGKRGPMREVERVRATAAAGLDGDLEATPRRAITLLAASQWDQATRELAADLPWPTRRANVLVACDRLDHLIGRCIQVGEVHVQVNAETRPCGLMDELHPGLRAALEPDGRGGVYGAIVGDGMIAVGDVVTVVD